MSSRRLNDLAPTFRPLAIELLARLTEAGLMVMIICTTRTAAEQAAAVARGASQVKVSKHQFGLAIDVCPYAQYALHGPDKLQWDNEDPAWQVIGKIAEGLGLRWGGRFGESAPGKGNGWDPGHCELPGPMP